MKKAFLMMAVAGLVFALPAVAGEGHAHAEQAAKKCNADAQTCLNWFAANYKGRGWAGVNLENTDAGLSITEVYPGTPAAQAGIKTGDILLAINGIAPSPENEAKMAALKEKMLPGNKFTYTISHNGKTKDVSFALAEMPMDVVARMVGMHMLNDHAAVEIAQAGD